VIHVRKLFAAPRGPTLSECPSELPTKLGTQSLSGQPHCLLWFRRIHDIPVFERFLSRVRNVAPRCGRDYANAGATKAHFACPPHPNRFSYSRRPEEVLTTLILGVGCDGLTFRQFAR
jgi:hypothetical protein